MVMTHQQKMLVRLRMEQVTFNVKFGCQATQQSLTPERVSHCTTTPESQSFVDVGTRVSDLAQLICGSSDVAFNKWFDNKPILLASSIYGLEQEDQSQCWSKKERVHVALSRPVIVSMYNKSMGGVDTCHRMKTRTRRWNFCIIAHFIDMALSKCWIENRIDSKSKIQLYDWCIAVALALINDEPASSNSSSDSDSEPRHGQIAALSDRLCKAHANRM